MRFTTTTTRELYWGRLVDGVFRASHECVRSGGALRTIALIDASDGVATMAAAVPDDDFFTGIAEQVTARAARGVIATTSLCDDDGIVCIAWAYGTGGKRTWCASARDGWVQEIACPELVDAAFTPIADLIDEFTPRCNVHTIH